MEYNKTRSVFKTRSKSTVKLKIDLGQLKTALLGYFNEKAKSPGCAVL